MQKEIYIIRVTKEGPNGPMVGVPLAIIGSAEEAESIVSAMSVVSATNTEIVKYKIPLLVLRGSALNEYD